MLPAGLLTDKEEGGTPRSVFSSQCSAVQGARMPGTVEGNLAVKSGGGGLS